MDKPSSKPDLVTPVPAIVAAVAAQASQAPAVRYIAIIVSDAGCETCTAAPEVIDEIDFEKFKKALVFSMTKVKVGWAYVFVDGKPATLVSLRTDVELRLPDGRVEKLQTQRVLFDGGRFVL